MKQFRVTTHSVTYRDLFGIVKLLCDQSFFTMQSHSVFQIRCLLTFCNNKDQNAYSWSPNSKQDEVWLCSLSTGDKQSLFWHLLIFFSMSNFQSWCSLTVIVMTTNGQHTFQHTLEHTVQDNTAKDVKITLNCWNEIVQSCVTVQSQIFK